MFPTVVTSWTFFWFPLLCLFWTYVSCKKLLLVNLNAEKCCCNVSKIWELCMHPDYDHFIPLTSK